MFQLLKVTGESLSPFFVQGDYVLITRLPSSLHHLKPGNVVVFRHPAYGTLIKRLDHLSEDGNELFVLGSHPESNDSRNFGLIPRRWVIGKVLWRIAG